ncbi:uncharacterized protein LOC131343149 [Hemibagrus wyckioides]|uniref:uncharacterized protein LOC131343149 n=1 Tax=Hemibagrus wyckioides TaxID=337641 RepID=UPI00266C2035|nr:uncharacterized protein LOC131343149 [Hemibagrus wyckioides]XP_058230573.1 uncharacterized protein LOC131343149 [Hemibagrus wyckioides]
MLLLLCTIALISETLSSSPLEAKPGDRVTLWCHHELYRASYIFWFKHTSTSVPLLVGCKQFTLSGQTQKCYFSPEPEGMVMSVHRKNTSLTISAVNVTDTGLYYCSFTELDKIIFSNSSYLHVKVDTVSEENKTMTTTSVRPEDFPALCSLKDAVLSSVFLMLSVISGVTNVIVIPLCVLIIIHKPRIHRGPEAQEEEQEQLSNKKDTQTSRHEEAADPHGVYTCVVYQNLA